jgi:UDP-N-acetylmuramoyl-L-alanyl-D-glutamate--2,6-diaminopimelate ligase
MKLEKLLNGVEITDTTKDIPIDKNIADVCYDSRRAAENSLFVCLRGSVTDGHKYALSAYEKGCRFFVAETHIDDLPSDAYVFLCPDTRRALAVISANLFEHPSRELFVIGITGTKGKTTTALMIAHVLNAAGMPCGYIGSNGIDYGNFHIDAVNTTPESYITQMYMRHMRMAGVKYLVMEVSSQALYMNRVHGIDFDVTVFTNLSIDHIGGSEHPTFEHYKDCKKTLFGDYGAKTVILNADDPYAAEMEAAIPTGTSILHYALHHNAEFCADSPTLYRSRDSLGISFELTAEGKPHTASLPFPGEFSVYNALAAIAVCRACGIPTERAILLLSSARIGGRFEMVDAMDNVTFVIDYAHNKLSMTAALETLRRYEPHRLICLFGSVGGRTFGRRRELGEAASSLADLCILTSDNPDGEDPMDILNDIAAAFEGTSCPYQIIPDRADAIRYAVSIAKKGDIFLFAGKGHETYQLVNGQKLPFSERDILLSACQSKTPQEV